MRLLKISYCFIIILALSCRQTYDLPFTGPAKGYLVVEGFINSGAGATTIKISRALGLVDSVLTRPEKSAVVTVEGNDNSIAPLAEISDGTYEADQLSISPNQQYRLHIKTLDGAEYYSAYATPKVTPAIDSISWEKTGKGVEVFVNTHDPTNNSTYYRWEYEETWEYHSAYYSILKYRYHPVSKHPYAVDPRPADESNKLFYCWQREKSSAILVGSSSHFSEDRIHLPLTVVPNTSWKLSVLYSILVYQYAVSAEEHEFFRRMKKNTENLGSLFDAQPSELVGNIHNSRNANEVVVGYVGIYNRQEKRIYIKNSEVPNWGYNQGCELFEAGNNELGYAGFKTDVPIKVHIYGMRNDTLSVYVALSPCGDCTLRGTNIKPSFWP